MFDVAGWAGGSLALIAYAIVTRFGTSAPYHLLNALGASGLLTNALYHGAFPLVVLNGLWCIIALWGLMRTIGRGRWRRQLRKSSSIATSTPSTATTSTG